MSEWKPIETAPRDGTAVLIAHCTVIGAWAIHKAAWKEPFEAAPNRQCWWSFGGGKILYDDFYHGEGATHWMPLPEPPEDSHYDEQP